MSLTSRSAEDASGHEYNVFTSCRCDSWFILDSHLSTRFPCSIAVESAFSQGRQDKDC